MIVFAELVADLRVTERPFKLVHRGGGEAVPSRSFEIECTVRAAGLRGAPKPKPGEATFDEVKAAFEREFLKSLLAIMKIELKRATSIVRAPRTPAAPLATPACQHFDPLQHARNCPFFSGLISVLRALPCVLLPPQEYHTIRAQKASSEGVDAGGSGGGGGGEEEEDGADAEDGGAQRGGPGSKGAQQADQERDDEDESEEEEEEGAKADARREGRNDAVTTARDADDDAAAGMSSDDDDDDDDGKSDGGKGAGGGRGGGESSSESEEEEAAPAAKGKGAKGAATSAKGAKGAAAAAAKGAKAKDAKKPAARFAAARKSSGIVTSLDMARDSVEADDKTGTLKATVALEIGSPKLLMLDIAQRAAAAAIVRQTPRIKKCYVIEEGGWRVQTDGVNFQAAWKQARGVLPDEQRDGRIVIIALKNEMICVC